MASRAVQFACLLCLQPGSQLVCSWCKEDACFYDKAYNMPANLLERPDIKGHLQHRHLDGLFAIGEYRWPLDVVIQKLKFHHKFGCAQLLAGWFAEHARVSTSSLPEIILPVPVPWTRLASRHFNQAAALARFVGREVDIDVDGGWARRSPGRKQLGLNRQKRLINLKQVYQIVTPLPYTHVAILDDVVTTGATVNVLAGALKAANPEIRVDVWAMAVTPARPSDC